MGLAIHVDGTDRITRYVGNTLRYSETVNGRGKLGLRFHARRSEFEPIDGQELIVYPEGLNYRDEVMADSPLVYHRLEEVVNTNTAAEDETSNNRDGVYAGTPTRQQGSGMGDASYGVLFDGVDDAVVTTYASWMHLSTLTVSFRMKFSANPASAQALVTRWTAAGNQRSWGVYLATDGRLRVSTSSNGTNSDDQTGGSALALNTWHVVQVTIAATAITVRVGGATAFTATGLSPFSTSTADLRYGRDGAGAWFAGYLDEVALFGAAVSSARLNTQYAARTKAGRLFGGFIAEPEEEIDGYSTLLHFDCEGEEFSSLCDRHLVAASYDSQTLGAIVRDIVADHLTADGVGLAGVEDGPTIDHIPFNYVTVTEAFNELSELTGYPWWIDANKVLQFRARGAVQSPFTVSDGDFVSMKVKTTRYDYRNRQYIRAGTDLTDPLTETFTGDGTRRTFNVSLPIGAVPTVSVNTGAGFVAKTVGIKQVDTGKDWYWNAGTNEVTQDTGGTLLATTHTLRVVFEGMVPIIVSAQADTEIAARIALEGGSGVYERIEDRPSIDDGDQALETASAILQRVGGIGKIVTIVTLDAGAKAGQLLPVNVAGHNLNTTLLIESVEANEWLDGQDVDDAVKLLYTLKCLSGDTLGGWQAYFRKLNQAGRQLIIRDNEVLLLLRTNSDEVYCLDVLNAISASAENRVGYARVGFAEAG